MKKICLIIILLLMQIKSSEQNSFTFKEYFDQYLEKYYTSSTYDYNNNTMTYEAWGWHLFTYLRLYETTKDKAYLNKFIEWSYDIQSKRDSYGLGNGTLWFECEYWYFNGILISPMAEFAYLVLIKEPALKSVLLLDPLNSNTLITYEDYANWLSYRVQQTLNTCNAYYWINDVQCYSKKPILELDGCQPEISEAEINQQALFACALYYISQISQAYNTIYLQKSNMILYKFKHLILESPYPNDPVNNIYSYTWWHNWYPGMPSGNYCREDVAHGGMDLQMILLGYDYGLYYNGFLFQQNDMINLNHTFTYNIWDRSQYQFFNNVYGTLFENSSDQTFCNYYVNGTQNFYGPGEVLSWMPLYRFDQAGSPPNDIYSILLNQAYFLVKDDFQNAKLPPSFWNNCSHVTHNLSGGYSLFGYSEVVKAQWDKECVNLTLYNRDVAYDQDFFAKNKLIIAPQLFDDLHTQNSNSFAEPITTGNDFIIRNGTTVNMSAGNEINLNPGTQIKAGSNFRAYINEALCMGGNKNLSTINNPKIGYFSEVENPDFSPNTLNEQNSDSIIYNNQRETSILILPNPFTETTQIKLEISYNTRVSLKIIDLYGLLIKQIYEGEINSGDYSFDYDANGISPGVYLCVFKTSQESITKQIILTR